MDTLGSLALATEPPTEDLLTRPPHSRDEYIISRTMFKHIIGQAIFQFIVIMVLVFAGEKFIPESVDSYDTGIFAGHPEYKWADGIVGGTVRSGRMKFVTGGSDYENIYNEHRIFSRHYTFIFNTFVMMQVFNFLNSKKLHEEVNYFFISVKHL
jgi:Ca2+ transporting ATPase